MVFYETDSCMEKEYSEEELHEQVDLLMESGLITKISSKAKNLLTKGKAVFRRRIKKVVDKDTGEDIEEVRKTEIPRQK